MSSLLLLKLEVKEIPDIKNSISLVFNIQVGQLVTQSKVGVKNSQNLCNVING